MTNQLLCLNDNIKTQQKDLNSELVILSVNLTYFLMKISEIQFPLDMTCNTFS